MTIDRAKIMQDAWTIARRFAGNRETWGQRLSRALKVVWWNAKQEAARQEAARKEAARQEAYRAAQRAAFAGIRTAEAIRTEIWSLECKDRLAVADFQSLDALRAELRAVA